MTHRLSTAGLDTLHSSVIRPAYDRNDIGIGHVHLGIGAFARAHTAVYTDDAIAAAGGDWGIAAVSLRRATVRDQLAPQDCLYTIAVADTDSVQRRLIGSIQSVAVAPDNPPLIVELLSEPTVKIVTLTVTEKGYCLAPESGLLDTENPDVRHDLENLEEPRTALGCLVAAMRRRRDEGAPPLTVISCDNLPGNGRRLAAAVAAFADPACPDLLPWIESSVRFPATMVDRIVPATTQSNLDEAETAIGLRDEALVCTEPYCQWVIEDDFANDRPAWDLAGALFVDDVQPYELAKLRLLNGAHSALAYLGYLAGYDFVHEAMQDSRFAGYVRHMMRNEISPVTPQPQGMQHDRYIDELLQRFANASLRHRTWQIAMDGSQKLPQRQLNTVRAQLRSGGPIAGLTLAIAAWIRYTLGRDENGDAIDVQDPLAERFKAIAASGSTEPQEIVAQYLQIGDVFGTDLAAQPRFTTLVSEQLGVLLEHGAAAAVAEYAATI